MYSKELEASVLGTVIVFGDKAKLLIELLSEEDFYYEDYRRVYIGIKRCVSCGIPVDVVSVREMMDDGIREGKNSILTQVIEHAGDSVSFIWYCKILKEYRVKRSLVSILELVRSNHISLGDIVEMITMVLSKAINIRLVRNVLEDVGDVEHTNIELVRDEIVKEAKNGKSVVYASLFRSLKELGKWLEEVRDYQVYIHNGSLELYEIRLLCKKCKIFVLEGYNINDDLLDSLSLEYGVKFYVVDNQTMYKSPYTEMEKIQ